MATVIVTNLVTLINAFGSGQQVQGVHPTLFQDVHGESFDGSYQDCSADDLSMIGDNTYTYKPLLTQCARCGQEVDLENLHPDSLALPLSGDFTATHGDQGSCDLEADPTGWISYY